MSKSDRKAGANPGKKNVEGAAKAVQASMKEKEDNVNGGEPGKDAGEDSKEQGPAKDAGEDKGEQKNGQEDGAGAGGEDLNKEEGKAGEGGEAGEAGEEKKEDGQGEEEDEEGEDNHQLPTPVPNAEQIEHSATFMAENPDLLEACRKTVVRAEQIIAERAQGPKKTAEELAGENHERLVKVYGKDFVTAAKGSNRGYYSRKAWNQMKNKRGWVEVTAAMPELEPAADPLDKSDVE